MKTILRAFLFVLVLGGCKGAQEESDGLGSFNDENASGKVQSRSFVALSGRTRFDSTGYNQWIVELYNESWTQPCAESFPPEYYINFTISKNVGRYPVSPGRPVNFIRSRNGFVQMAIATEGEVEITKIENGYVVGRLLSKYDDENLINGEFWAQICN